MQASVWSQYQTTSNPHLIEWISSSAAWCLYLFCLMVHCAVYDIYVHAASPRLAEALLWAAKEWGLWVLLTPLVMRKLRHSARQRPLRLYDYLVLAVALFSVAMVFRVSLDLYLQEADFFASIIMHASRYVLGSIAVFLLWMALSKTNILPSLAAARPERTPIALMPPAYSPTEAQPGSRGTGTLLVDSGSEKHLILVSSIRFAKAARNYVELYAQERSYIMRSTISQLEQLLPSDQFVRIHRSNIVNLEQVQSVRRLPSGAGRLSLHCGAEVAVSKRYLATLQALLS